MTASEASLKRNLFDLDSTELQKALIQSFSLCTGSLDFPISLLKCIKSYADRLSAADSEGARQINRKFDDQYQGAINALEGLSNGSERIVTLDSLSNLYSLEVEQLLLKY